MSHPTDGRRASDVPCPVCKSPLRRPWPGGDYPNWECRECGLEVPGEVVILDGRRLIELANAQPDPAAFLGTILAG